MGYKEKTLEWTKENLDYTNPEGFHRRLKEYLTSLPAETEIAKRMMLQYLGGHPAQMQPAYEWVCGFQDYIDQQEAE